MNCRHCGEQLEWTQTWRAAILRHGRAQCRRCGQGYKRVEFPRWFYALLGGSPWVLAALVQVAMGARFSLVGFSATTALLYIAILAAAPLWTRLRAVDGSADTSAARLARQVLGL